MQSILSRRAVVAGVMAALTMTSPALAQIVDINGSFRAEGRNPDGSAYQGRATVAEVNGAVQINWSVGNQNYAGTGIRDGQIVVVNWGVTHPVIYVVMANGNLHGIWEDGRALERLIRQ